jgi:NADH dehydrogenase
MNQSNAVAKNTVAKNAVVLGGGYAGTLAANRLRRNADVAVTLVNPRPSFVERFRLHELAAGSGDATRDYATVLRDDVRVVVDTAVRIDAAARSVELASGDALSYDYLVYAVGSTSAVSDAVPGAAQFAFPVGEFEQARRLRTELDELRPNAPICVVGGGLTSIETASELAGQRRAGVVTLVCGGVLGPSVGERARGSLRRQLTGLGVTVLEGSTVAGVCADHVRLGNGRELPSAVTIWTAGFAVPDLATRSGLSTDALGRLRTDETLTSIDDPRIIAAGDSAAPSGRPLRMSCQAALPLGAQAANTVLSRIAGSEPAPVDQAFTGQCISLGRHGGTIQISHRDDTTRRLYVGGRAAALVKELVCKATVSFIAREARKPGSYLWLKGGTRPADSAVAVR